MGKREIEQLQEALVTLGYKPGKVDSLWGPRTKAALNEWQRDNNEVETDGFDEDSLAQILYQVNKGMEGTDALDRLTPEIVARMCPSAPMVNILEGLPHVKNSLRKCDLTDKEIILMAIATIRVETGAFKPLSEFKSRFNTDEGKPLFNRYDNRRDLGNLGAPDGSRFKGRGFIQLTGRTNYATYGKKLGVDLVENPSMANTYATAADVLALFLKDREVKMRSALKKEDFATARKLVNGGTMHLAEFTESYKIGARLLR